MALMPIRSVGTKQVSIIPLLIMMGGLSIHAGIIWTGTGMRRIISGPVILTVGIRAHPMEITHILITI